MNEKPNLDAELERLLERVPDRIARVIRKVRGRKWAAYRIPLAIALIGGGILGFLPVLGFWMVPLGLLLLAQDVPALRPVFARLLAKINGRWARSTPQ
jgi:hypothetical protein